MLTMDQIRARAPSVFATEASLDMTNKYRFIPTSEVVEGLVAEGFQPVKAMQTKTRLPVRRDFARHVIRFRHPSLPEVKGEMPELVLINSHDGTSSYRLMFGVFVMVCSNGLIVCSSMFDDFRTRHIGGHDIKAQVIEGSFKIVNEAPAVMGEVAHWKQQRVTASDQEAYAVAALELSGSTIKPHTSELLEARYSAQAEPTVWNTFQNVQRNMVAGGCYARDAKDRVVRTRGIKSVSEDTRMNRALWKLTEHFAKEIA